jgi:hypothetical protein
MNSREGIVVKVTEQYIVVIHPEDGTFANIPRLKNQVPHLGENFTYQPKSLFLFSKSKWIKLASVACLLILSLFAWPVFQVKDASAAAYVVAFDINPSLEVYFDSQLHVIKIVAMNKDGENVISGLDYTNKNLSETINSIIDRCVEQHYLKPDQKGNITTTIIPLTSDNKLDQTAVSAAINNALSDNHIKAQVHISVDEKNTLDKANQLQLSINKYKLFKQLQQNGITVPIEDVRQQSIKELLNLLPADNGNGLNKVDSSTPIPGGEQNLSSGTSDGSIINNGKDKEALKVKEQKHSQVPKEKTDASGTDVPSHDVNTNVNTDTGNKEIDPTISIDQKNVPTPDIHVQIPNLDNVVPDQLDTGSSSQEPIVIDNGDKTQDNVELPNNPTFDHAPTGE